MKLLLKIVGGLLVVTAAVIGFAFFRFSRMAAASFTPPSFSISAEVAAADLELGKRIYTVRSGCIECHGANLAGAKIIDNPMMGTIHGPNISPFTLKTWSDEQIATAIRYGIHKDGRSLRFMPSFDFEGLSKGDVAAVVAYLRSAEEVPVRSHPSTFGPMARVLTAFGQIPIMFPAFVVDPTRGFQDKPEEGPTVEFGRYLANSCIGCHGPNFSGGKIPGGDPSWPPASDIRLGADSFWTEQKFRELIATGRSPRTGEPLKPPMPVPLLQQLNDTEIVALWKFLATVK